MRRLWAILAGLTIVASALPYVPTDLWLVRMADFPRLHVLALCLLLLAASAPLAERASVWILRIGLGLAALAHAVVLAPYFTPFGEDRRVSDCAPGDRLTAMVANVRMTNDPDRRLAEQVRAVAPDVLLALEVNAAWAQELSGLADILPAEISQPADDYYGLTLRAVRPFAEGGITRFVDADVPSVDAVLPTTAGTPLRIIGLHPRPPHPGQSAAPRDRQLRAAADTAAGALRPVVLMGDLNATPWETVVDDIVDRARISDPREAFGYLPSYSATSWWRSWPLDHVLPGDEVGVLDLRLGEAFGSDHLPVIAELCVTPAET